jgi:hypothetical protein
MPSSCSPRARNFDIGDADAQPPGLRRGRRRGARDRRRPPLRGRTVVRIATPASGTKRPLGPRPRRPAPPGGPRISRSCRRSSSPPARSARSRSGSGQPAVDAPPTGRHAGLTTVPHGAKSFLAAGSPWRRRPASGCCGSPATRRSATGWPTSWGLAGRPGRSSSSSRGPPWPTSAASSSRRDGRPGGGPGRMAQRRGPGPGRQRPGAPPAHDRNPADLPAEPRHLARATGSSSTASCSSCSAWATSR